MQRQQELKKSVTVLEKLAQLETEKHREVEIPIQKDKNEKIYNKIKWEKKC